MNFTNIIGQKKAITQIEALLKHNRIPTGLLLCGLNGIGKKLTAMQFAKILNCLDKNDVLKSCEKCRSCKSIDKNIHPDIILADFYFQAELTKQSPQKQQHIKIETIRELINKAQQKPMLGNWKVFIIDHAQTMLSSAANALLKFLEEPPPKTLWILITTKKSAMLPTITSRCQTVNFANLTKKEVEKILLEKKFSSKQSENFAILSGGSVEKAYEVRDMFEKICQIDTSDANFPFEISQIMPKELVLARQKARILLELLLIGSYEKWRTCKLDKSKSEICKFMQKLKIFEIYLNRNVSPHRIIQLAFLNAEKVDVNPFEACVNMV